MAELSEEAKILTEALEYHADDTPVACGIRSCQAIVSPIILSEVLPNVSSIYEQVTVKAKADPVRVRWAGEGTDHSAKP